MTPKEDALARIQEALDTDATSLDLSGLSISEIPVELKQLTEVLGH